jgi:hypothetical protein
VTGAASRGPGVHIIVGDQDGCDVRDQRAEVLGPSSQADRRRISAWVMGVEHERMNGNAK